MDCLQAAAELEDSAHVLVQFSQSQIRLLRPMGIHIVSFEQR
jgi:hypothetical protein